MDYKNSENRLTPTETQSSLPDGNFAINLLPAFSSAEFRGLNLQTTLILHSDGFSFMVNDFKSVQIHTGAEQKWSLSLSLDTPIRQYTGAFSIFYGGQNINCGNYAEDERQFSAELD